MTGLTSPNYLRPGSGPQTDATASQTGSGPQTGPATHAGATASRLGTKDRPHPAGGAEAASQVPLKVMGRGTLSRQLVLRVTALVALVAIALSAITAFAIQQILVGQTDQQLRELAARPQKISDRDPLGATGGIGRQDGLLLYRVITDPYTGLQLEACSVQTGNQQVDPSASARSQLRSLPSGTSYVTLPDGLGLYRVYAYTDASGGHGVVGLPATLITAPMLALLPAAGLFTLGAIAVAYLAGRTVVQRSLAPLQRLATTAHQVSELELDSGEVAVPVRVPSSDTDPRSEVGQVGLAFNHMLDNVEGALTARQASEMKVRQFVADASHELRNPLASIRGYAELTRRERDEVPDDTAHALGRIESESARMSALVEDLLLLARLDAGPNLALTPTPLNEIVANAVSDAQVAGPDHEWTLSLPEADVVAIGDPFRLLQVISNLLANARVHTPAGTEVQTSLSAEGPYAVVRVSDNGPGIPEGIRDKVFERFTRADASRVRSGGQSTGLGLAIVSAVVGAHRGSASVESSANGTTFTVRVPLARES